MIHGELCPVRLARSRCFLGVSSLPALASCLQRPPSNAEPYSVW